MSIEIKKIIVRQGTEAERKQVTLESGEPGYCTDSKRFYIGTGTGPGVPVGTNNLGMYNFSGPLTNIPSNLAPISGDFCFDKTTNLTYMLTGTDFAKVSAFAPYGSQFTTDNVTLELVNNLAQIKNNGISPVKLNASGIGQGLERISSNTVLRTKLSSKLEFDTTGAITVAAAAIENENLAMAPANTIKGRLNTPGQPGDLSVADLVTLLAGAVTTVPIGTILDWAGSGTLPVTYLECNGQAVSRTNYQTLFLVLSTSWGSGDGVTTFNLPDLRRRTTIGSGGTPTAILDNVVGSYGGSEFHILSANEGKCEFDVTADFVQGGSLNVINNFMAGLTITNRNNIDFDFAYPEAVGSRSGTVGSTEADPHNNMQPSAVVRKIIKAVG